MNGGGLCVYRERPPGPTRFKGLGINSRTEILENEQCWRRAVLWSDLNIFLLNTLGIQLRPQKQLPSTSQIPQKSTLDWRANPSSNIVDLPQHSLKSSLRKICQENSLEMTPGKLQGLGEYLGFYANLHKQSKNSSPHMFIAIRFITHVEVKDKESWKTEQGQAHRTILL